MKKEQLFLIGDSATIGADSFYNAFLTYVEQQGTYRTVWEFEVLSCIIIFPGESRLDGARFYYLRQVPDSPLKFALAEDASRALVFLGKQASAAQTRL